MDRLTASFYKNNAVEVAQNLIGKTLVRVFEDGVIQKYTITATEAYMGEEDLACHANKGRTPRTEVMYAYGGHAYVYLIYGIHWMFNVVTGEENHPQAVLICGLDKVKGSGRVGKLLKIDKSFYGENLLTSEQIWIENNNAKPKYTSIKRVGVDYAKEWKDKLWRFELNSEL